MHGGDRACPIDKWLCGTFAIRLVERAAKDVVSLCEGHRADPCAKDAAAIGISCLMRIEAACTATKALLRVKAVGISYVLLAVGLLGATPAIASAAQLADVNLPDTRQVAGTRLLLNGAALRTYSILHVRIYVAGLYLQQRDSNAQAVLRSPEMKLLEIHFLRDVGADAAREAWRTGFANNCEAPCHLDPQAISRFMAKVPAVHRGDVSMFLFTRNGMTVTFNGRTLGTTDDLYFAQQVLRTFIGPVPATPRVKRELLGGR